MMFREALRIYNSFKMLQSIAHDDARKNCKLITGHFSGPFCA
jgi:hypothetical protein